MRERRTLKQIIDRAMTWMTLVVIGVILLATGATVLERSIGAAERREQNAQLKLDTFEFQVLNAETGFRGFALSQKEPFLAPYREAFPAIERLRSTLMRLVDKRSRPYLEEAFRAIDDWRRNFAEPALRDFRAGVGDAARAAIRGGEGKRRIDRIRSLVDQIRENENADLVSAHTERTVLTVALVVILVLGLTGGVLGGRRVAWVLNRAVVRPMSNLAAVTHRIQGGELSARAEVRGAAEVAIVAQSLNEMAGEVEKVVHGLREVDELKTQFLSTVSHELRTPLTSINGYLQLLEQGVAGELAPEQLEYVRVAQRNGERLTALIDDLLMLSRIDAGRIELRLEAVDLSQQLRYLREELEPVAAKGATLLELDAPDELIVEGDARRLQQSFANLVSNAIKFNRAGGHVWLRACAQDGMAVVEVSDEGVGIPLAEVQRIGERFFRASTTKNMPGTGLGLAITREIIERHGGTLNVESEVGKGSTFRITLPQHPLAQSPARDEEEVRTA